MIIPCIHISRQDIGIYDLAIMVENELMDSEQGNVSITDCLTSAAMTLSGVASIVEVRYRGIHLGSFSVREISDTPAGVADRIIESYAALIEHAS